MDNWKLYVNYRKIKNYLLSKKKKKIFEALRENINDSKKLEKKARYLNFILIAKNFYKKLKIYPLKIRNYIYNNQLAYENRNNLLKKKIFNLLKDYYTEVNYRKIKNNK